MNDLINCPFCAKTADDFIMETEHFAAIYNISPIVPGHTLVIPKVHFESIMELNDKQFNEFMALGRKLTTMLCDAFKTDSFDWAIQEKEAAGQSVPHLHMHIVPRTMGDLTNPGDWYREMEKRPIGDIDTYDKFRLTENELAEITQRLKKWAVEHS